MNTEMEEADRGEDGTPTVEGEENKTFCRRSDMKPSPTSPTNSIFNTIDARGGCTTEDRIEKVRIVHSQCPDL